MGWKQLLKSRVEALWPGGKQIAEALEAVGAYSERLSTGVVQGIQTASATQNYRLGATLRKPDGRVFKYAKAGATLNTDLGVDNYNWQHVAYNTIAVAAVAEATQVVLDVAASDGAAADGVIALDELVGGYLVIFPHSENSINRRIIGNTAVATGEMTLTLDDPIPVALVVDSDHGECMASPYLDVRNTANSSKPIMGIPSVVATAALPYFWLQTWGPVWIAPQGAVSDAANDFQIVFRHDGSVDEHDYTDALLTKNQHAGFAMAQAQGGGQGAPFFMLQITQ